MGRDITQCHPKLQELAGKLVKECKRQGLKIAIGECVRTVAEQDALYALGRTKPGKIVTNAKGRNYRSMHQWGVAFDFYRNDGKGAFNEKGGFFDKVGKIGAAIGLEWGGNWKSIKDKPHFQLPDWGSTPSELIGLYGTPGNFKKTWKEPGRKLSKPTTTVTTKSSREDILWLQQKANLVIVRTGLKDADGRKLAALKEDGIYGKKSREFVKALWNLLGWKNNDTIGNAGRKTLAFLDQWM